MNDYDDDGDGVEIIMITEIMISKVMIMMITIMI